MGVLANLPVGKEGHKMSLAKALSRKGVFRTALNLLHQRMECHVPVSVPGHVFFNKGRGMLLEVFINVGDRMGKILNAIGNTTVLFVVQEFEYFAFDEKAGRKGCRNIICFHPVEPFRFNSGLHVHSHIVQHKVLHAQIYLLCS